MGSSKCVVQSKQVKRAVKDNYALFVALIDNDC